MVFNTRITALLWADMFAMYAIWLVMTFLTDVWELSPSHAASILNIWGGLVLILPVAVSFFAETFLGHFSVLLVSTTAYCVGLGLLSISTPPVTGSCSAYQSKCIGDKQKILFYTALASIAVGLAGHLVSLAPFFMTEAVEGMLSIFNDLDRGVQNTIRRVTGQFLGHCFVIVVMIAGIIVLAYVKPWSVRFGVPAVISAVALLIFLSGSCSYRYNQPGGSPLITIFRVVVASASKMFHRSKANASQLYENPNRRYKLRPTYGLRCLEKAAIIKPDSTLEEQEKNIWSLCRVTEVEETKTFFRMIPVFVTLIICGVVSSIGNTFFLVQASKMNPKVGRLKVPLQMFLFLHEFTKGQSASIYLCIAGLFQAIIGSRKYAAPMGFVLAMICSVLCCITAAKVENRRLDVVRTHGLVDKPDERVPMTMFWLVPQFILLGALDGICDYAIQLYVADRGPASMKTEVVYFSTAVKGLGIMGSAVTIHLAGEYSEKGGKLNWFQDTLNESRLDKYYWLLAAMSAVNLGLFILVAALCLCREPKDNEDVEEPIQSDEGGEQEFVCNAGMFCCCGDCS